MRPGRAAAGPSSTPIASARLPSVADRPHTTRSGFQRLSRASSNCTCTPRLLPISSCHSSTITSWMPASRSRASARVSSSVKDSGVLTSAVGSRRSCRARSAAGVSPLRRPIVQARSQRRQRQRQRARGVGRQRAHRRDPQRGERRGGAACFVAHASARRAQRPAPARPSTPHRSCRRRWWRAAGRSRTAAIAAHTSRWKANGLPAAGGRTIRRASTGAPVCVSGVVTGPLTCRLGRSRPAGVAAEGCGGSASRHSRPHRAPYAFLMRRRLMFTA